MISIRPATMGDLSILVKIGRETFAESFAKDNTQENLEAYMNIAFSEDQIKREIEGENEQFFLAFDGDMPVGYAKMRLSDEVELGNSIELQRIYVDKNFQGRKIGVGLLQRCIDYARDKDFEWVWLGVWENNHKAKGFYIDWEFEKFGEHIFQVGDDPQTDWLMKRRV